MQCRRLTFLLMVPVFLFVLPRPSVADSPEKRFTLTASVVGVSPSGDLIRSSLPEGEGRFDVSSGSGLGLALDYRLSPRWGVGLSLRSASLDTQLRVATTAGTLEAHDSLRFEMYGLSGSYRFLVRERLELYALGAVVMSKGSDQVFVLDSSRQIKLTFDDDIGFEFALGADFQLGGERSWVLSGVLGHLVTILETDSGFQDMDLDPWTLQVGVGYRF